MYYQGYEGGVSGGGQGDPPPPPPVPQDGGHRMGGDSVAPVGAQPPSVARDCDAFHRLYIVYEEIGRGAFSVVYRCQHRVTGEDFAVKIIDMRPLQLRENFDQTRLRREVEIMRRLNHPNIIRLEEVFETPKNLLLVLEYAFGTELFDSILQRKRYTEAEARPIFEQVAQALGYLHSLNIIHRDIKPENVILLDRPSPQGYYPCAKLLDFGLSKMIGQDDGSAARTFVGTPCYLAPEVEARAYGRGQAYGSKVDCWSLGAVLYVMLVARFPEFDRSNGGMRVKMESPSWATVSDAAKDLIQRLMQPDPQIRYSVMDALRHPWVTGAMFYNGAAGGLTMGMGRMGLNAALGVGVGGGVFNGQAPTHAMLPPRPVAPPGVAYPPQGVGMAPSFVMGRAGSDGSLSGGSPGMSEQGSFEGPNAAAAGPQGSQHGGAGVGAGLAPGMEVFKLTPSGEQVGEQVPLNRFLSLWSAVAPPGACPDPRLQLDPSAVRTHLQMDPNTEVVRSSMGEGAQQQVQAFQPEGAALLPLLNIQHTIANSIELAYRACEHNFDDVEDIKRSAILCRAQLIQTIKLLRKIEQTASSVLEMFPDLELAVEDGEPRLAHDFFATVKRWVGDLRHTVSEAQQRNQESMLKLHNIITGDLEGPPRLTEMSDGPPMTPVSSTSSATSDAPASRDDLDAMPGQQGGSEAAPSPSGPASRADARLESMPSTDMDVAGARRRTDKVGICAHAPKRQRVQPVLDNTTGTPKVRRREEIDGLREQSPAPPKTSRVDTNDDQQVYMSLEPELLQSVKKLKEARDTDSKLSETQLLDLFFSVNGSGDGVRAAFGDSHDGGHHAPPAPKEDLARGNSTSTTSSGGSSGEAPAPQAQGQGQGAGRLSAMEQSVDTAPHTQATPMQEGAGGGEGASYSPTRAGPGAGADRSRELNQVLNKMRDVDSILEHLAIFWAQTEVILDVLLQKSEHVERFVEFAHKPRLLSRFQQRMGEYKRFWASVQTMCGKYLQAVNQLHASSAGVAVTAGAGGRCYSFLDGNRR